MPNNYLLSLCLLVGLTFGISTFVYAEPTSKSVEVRSQAAKVELATNKKTKCSKLKGKARKKCLKKKKKKPVRFSFEGAIGLALKSKTSSASIGTQTETDEYILQIVTVAGTLEDAIACGAITIKRFLIAPNDKLYVLFSEPVNLATCVVSNVGCLLGEVSTDTGIPTCIDDEAASIAWSLRSPGDLGALVNEPIQFDGSGAIYYLARTDTGATVLRKYSAGTITDLVNENITINDFLVLSDGNVIIDGTTNSTGISFVRRITSQGGLQNLVSTTGSKFLSLFSDSNVYIGLSTFGNFGVRRYLSSSAQLESKYWLSDDNPNSGTPEVYNRVSDICTDDVQVQMQSFCLSYGTEVKGVYRTVDGKTFAILDAVGSYRSVLMRYFPSFERQVTQVTKVTAAQGVISYIVLAGLNSSDRNIMTLYNTADKTELQLIGSDNEIEIYHLNYLATGNKIVFDGLRFSDNKYVIGKYDLNTMTLTASQTGSTKLIDFQTFQ